VSAGNGAAPLLSIRGVETYYGKIVALRGIDIDVHEGKIVALIGANGAGKSTLMMTICGNPRARTGFDQLRRRGHHPAAHTPDHGALDRAVAGRPPHLPRMTVLENLQMGAAINKFVGFDQDLERVYTLFPRLKERQNQRGGTLSGGEQQMLSIGPRADEPAAAPAPGRAVARAWRR
jgi:branched-chain amino acid transport system ATP-binding protein